MNDEIDNRSVCGTCRYWDAHHRWRNKPPVKGFCRHELPNPGFFSDTFPITWRGEWCGKFERHPLKPIDNTGDTE